jgi:hypothetical protein
MDRPRLRGAGPVVAFILSASIASLAFAWEAPNDYLPVFLPELTVSRASGPIRVDGVLDDAGWRGSSKATRFFEHNPGDQTKPEVDTEVLVTFDERNFYVGWVCFDDPEKIRSSFCERDNIFSDDYVILCLDTFGESSLAYEISANPHGIPGDLLFSVANGEDISYDIIYESAARITDFGWVAEMAIPFASLRFPDRDEQVWRVDFWRNRPRESRYQYSWAAYNRDENCWPCQWGTVRGISNVRAGAGIEALPSIVAHQSGALDTDGRFETDSVDGELGLGISYDVSSELTAEATINPDFSQVESDAAQIDVNSTFALFYPERRPFFQEGSDLFETFFEAVYTRSVNDPLVAGKTTWRKGPNSVAMLSAADDHSVVTLPFEESSNFVENGRAYSNVLRARRDFGGQSHLGAVVTDRRFVNGGSGSLMGVDGQVRFSPSDAARFQLLATYTDEIDKSTLTDSTFNTMRFDDDRHTAALDGETFWGHGAFLQLSRETRDYWLGGEYWERSATFRADNGFEPSNNSRIPSTWIGGIKRFEESNVVESISGTLNAARKWNFDGLRKDEWLDASVETRFRAAQTLVHTRYLWSNELFGGRQFNNIWQSHLCFQSLPMGSLRFGGNIDYGHRIARNFLVMGAETTYGLWADIQPVARLLLSLSSSRITSDHLETGERLFSQTVFRGTVSLQFLRELSARLIVQYNDRFDSWDVDPLITYRINPFSIFYVGSTRDYRRFDGEEDPLDGWALARRQYFMKVQYLFQL